MARPSRSRDSGGSTRRATGSRRGCACIPIVWSSCRLSPDCTLRRLTRTSDVAQTNRCILDALVKEVGAQIAAIATFNEAEQALTIVATHGYPLSIVEHLRILPGQGVFGQAFLTGRATIVVVAHRLSTVIAADRIYVVDGGRVVEHGNHRELIRQGGVYSKLFADSMSA